MERYKVAIMRKSHSYEKVSKLRQTTIMRYNNYIFFKNHNCERLNCAIVRKVKIIRNKIITMKKIAIMRETTKQIDMKLQL